MAGRGIGGGSTMVSRGEGEMLPVIGGADANEGAGRTWGLGSRLAQGLCGAIIEVVSRA